MKICYNFKVCFTRCFMRFFKSNFNGLKDLHSQESYSISNIEKSITRTHKLLMLNVFLIVPILIYILATIRTNHSTLNNILLVIFLILSFSCVLLLSIRKAQISLKSPPNQEMFRCFKVVSGYYYEVRDYLINKTEDNSLSKADFFYLNIEDAIEKIEVYKSYEKVCDILSNGYRSTPVLSNKLESIGVESILVSSKEEKKRRIIIITFLICCVSTLVFGFWFFALGSHLFMIFMMISGFFLILSLLFRSNFESQYLIKDANFYSDLEKISTMDKFVFEYLESIKREGRGLYDIDTRKMRLHQKYDMLKSHNQSSELLESLR